MKATPWGAVRALKADEITDRQRLQAHLELMSEIAAHRLADIRKARNLTQSDVARSMDVGQRRVSAIESAELARTEIGTIASYVEALGGHLRLVADFGDQAVALETGLVSPKTP